MEVTWSDFVNNREFHFILVGLLFLYVLYLFIALKVYLKRLDALIKYNESLGVPLKFVYSWRGVILEPVSVKDERGRDLKVTKFLVGDFGIGEELQNQKEKEK